MIYGYLHQGSGIGNQLFRYITTRVRALDLWVEWRMIWNPDNSGKEVGFKAKDFITFDESKVLTELPKDVQEWTEKKVIENGVDVRGYDPEINFVDGNAVIEGEFQDERYWAHREKEINEWLKVQPIEFTDDVCVIGFRGGEYSVFPDLFLTRDYWNEAIKIMREINPKMLFEVHTDDEKLAKEWFPFFPIISNAGVNWRSMRYAKYAIIANSSFYILPRWLRHGESEAFTLAPRYWARRNTKTWALPQNYYSRFRYI